MTFYFHLLTKALTGQGEVESRDCFETQFGTNI